MPKSAPIAATDEAYLAGAQIYDQHCGICHGYPGMEQTDMAKGMFPKPPHLFRGKGVTDDEPGETYWKVANGIRLTGMPEFKHILNDTQMWQVSLLLANADKISDAVKQQLTPGPPPGSNAAGRANNAGNIGAQTRNATTRTLVYFSAVTLRASSRSRGPSNSISTTRCHVPSSKRFFSKGRATEVPINAERM